MKIGQAFTLGFMGLATYGLGQMSGINNDVARVIQDDLMGHFSRQAVASRLSEVGRCEFELNMEGFSCRMEGVLAAQKPLIKIQKMGDPKTFIMSLGDREITLSSDSPSYGGFPRKLGEESPNYSIDHSIDSAFRQGIDQFEHCKSIPEPKKEPEFVSVHSLVLKASLSD